MRTIYICTWPESVWTICSSEKHRDGLCCWSRSSDGLSGEFLNSSDPLPDFPTAQTHFKRSRSDYFSMESKRARIVRKRKVTSIMFERGRCRGENPSTNRIQIPNPPATYIPCFTCTSIARLLWIVGVEPCNSTRIYFERKTRCSGAQPVRGVMRTVRDRERSAPSAGRGSRSRPSGWRVPAVLS